MTNKEDKNIANFDGLSYSDIVSMDQKACYSDSDLDLFLQLSPM